MSQNKRCHAHMANGIIIRFMATTYQSLLSASYESRSETEAQKRTIKNILNTLTRLLQDTIMVRDLLEQRHLQQYSTMSAVGEKTAVSSLRNGSSPSRDITVLVRQMLLSPKSEGEQQRPPKVISNSPASSATVEKLRVARTVRQESYV